MSSSLPIRPAMEFCPPGPEREVLELRRANELLVNELRRLQQERQPEKKLKLYVWRGFEPGWSGGLAFALAYTKDEARAAVEKAWHAKVNEWGRLRVHRVEAGRAEAVAGGG